MRFLLILSFIALICFCGNSCAQVGLKLSEVAPNGDIGQYFNKAFAPDLYLIDYFSEGRLRIRMGFLYSQLTPRKDTVPIYGMEISANSANPLYLPGFLVNHTMTLYYVHGDFCYRFLHIRKKFSLYGGLGVVVGAAKSKYEKEIETVMDEKGSGSVAIGGYSLVTNIEYQISEHFDILSEIALMHVSTTDYATSYLHSTYSLGVNWIFRERPGKHHTF